MYKRQAFAFGCNAAYAHFIAAPNEALIGAAEDVELELCSYAVEKRVVVRRAGGDLVEGVDLSLIHISDRVKNSSIAKW